MEGMKLGHSQHILPRFGEFKIATTATGTTCKNRLAGCYVVTLLAATHNTNNMPHIVIISASVRRGRHSHRVALYFEKYLAEHQLATAEILDLDAYRFPIFDERLKFQPEPGEKVLEFAEKVKKADGVIIVTPEYNGGYPAAIKNVVDLLYDEWRRKPIAISTVSDGQFGGTQVITSLQFSLWKIRSWTVPAQFPVPKVETVFDAEGNALDKASTDKRAANFIGELLWCVEARALMAAAGK